MCGDGEDGEREGGVMDWLTLNLLSKNVVYHFFRFREADKGRETERKSDTKADKDESTPRPQETEERREEYQERTEKRRS